MSKIGFLKYMFNNMKKHILNDMYQSYQIKERFPTSGIESGVQIKGSERLFLGENVIIQKDTILHCGGMKWCDYKGSIKIGDNSCLSPNNVLYGSGEIDIGHSFATGPGVIITSQTRNLETGLKSTDYRTEDSNRYSYKKVTIGNYVSISSGSVILPGVTIGDNSIIGANSVVAHNIPSNSLALGSPARVVKKLLDEPKIT